MTSLVSIRQASVADVPALVELRACMLTELDSNDPARMADLAVRSAAWFRRAMPEGRATGFLAEKDGRVVGGLSLTLLDTQPQYRSPEGRVASIWGLFVYPGHRGAGIASQLVANAVAYCREHGVDVITLHAADRARPIYERAGFSASNEMRMFLTQEGSG